MYANSKLNRSLFFREALNSNRVFINIFILFFGFGIASAQEQNARDFLDRIQPHLELKNQHTWHGSIVTPGVMAASSIEYRSLDDKFVAGFWGGASFNGDYKELAFYTNYKVTDLFILSLISHNNYSNAGDDYDILSYDKETSPNFVDVVLEYTLSEQTPLKLYWSTILFGQGGDYKIENDGDLTDSYSTYAELSYTFFSKEKTALTLFAGGAFSFATDKTFYSEEANFTNIGLDVRRDVKIFDKIHPVSAKVFINPEIDRGVLQVTLPIF